MLTPWHKFLALIAISVWLIGSSLFRLWRRRAESQKANMDEVVVDPIRIVLQVGGSLALAIGLLLGLPLFFQGQPLMGGKILALAIFISSATDGASDWHFPTPKSQQFWLPLAQSIVLATVGFGGLCYALYLHSIPGPNSQAMHAEWPFEGTWCVVTGGRSPLTNYHQRDGSGGVLAVDFTVDGPTDASLGLPVFSPVDGTVSRAVGDLFQGEDPAEGNVIEIQAADGITIHLSHLQRHSLLVAEGDQVAVGQHIANCGNSGSAVEAHLHVHAERGGSPVPILFGTRGEFPVRNQMVETE